MLPVTQTSLVRALSERRVDRRGPTDLRTFLRLEYNGAGADAEWLVAQARKSPRSASVRSSRRGVLSGLFEALSSAFPRPGGD